MYGEIMKKLSALVLVAILSSVSVGAFALPTQNAVNLPTNVGCIIFDGQVHC